MDGFAQSYIQERHAEAQAMFMIGCAGDANRVLKEGGYECRGLYTAPGFFAPAAQEVLVNKVRELAQRAGRKLPD